MRGNCNEIKERPFVLADKDSFGKPLFDPELKQAGQNLRRKADVDCKMDSQGIRRRGPVGTVGNVYDLP
jgi:hypothetical protein